MRTPQQAAENLVKLISCDQAELQLTAIHLLKRQVVACKQLNDGSKFVQRASKAASRRRARGAGRGKRAVAATSA